MTHNQSEPAIHAQFVHQEDTWLAGIIRRIAVMHQKFALDFVTKSTSELMKDADFKEMRLLMQKYRGVREYINENDEEYFMTELKWMYRERENIEHAEQDKHSKILLEDVNRNITQYEEFLHYKQGYGELIKIEDLLTRPQELQRFF